LRLYKHALESIFAYLNLPELARVTATCRDWSAAVNSMRSIGASVRVAGTLLLQAICTSRLLRHVAELHKRIGSLDASGIASLCGIIKQSKSLLTVVLIENSIGGADTVAIAEAIKQSKSLATVRLNCNSIGVVGAAAVAEAITQSKSMTNVWT